MKEVCKALKVKLYKALRPPQGGCVTCIDVLETLRNQNI